MHKVILFRGGMCGDIVFSMLDKNYVKSLYPLHNANSRNRMKQFHKYNKEEKIHYFESFNNSNDTEYTLSHDTEFCKSIVKNTIQLYCSDSDLLRTFSERFWIKNNIKNTKHLIEDLKTNENDKVDVYLEDIKSWQKNYLFPVRFDVKNVFTKNFPYEFNSFFKVVDFNWSKTIHKEWLSLNT